jgi:diguanylate cyclase (GGDEF)-like protein
MAMSIDNARLHELTITDSLTELYIQKYFHIRLEDEIKRARRFNFPLTLVVFDVDKLKDVNDEYGMKMGDAVLWEIARILKESVRATDIPCRSGPEEFAVILAHTNAEQALIFAERLRERIAAFKITRAEKSVMVTISMGIAQYNVGIETPDDLVNLADMAVNESKSKGGNKTTTSENEPGGND